MFLRNILPLIMLISIFSTHLWAQSNPVEEEVVEQTLQGMEAVVQNAVAAAFIPMADYDKGDLLFIGSPGYLRIREVYQKPSISGDPLNGGTLGMGAGYALDDRFMVYGIFTGLYLKGALEGEFYSDDSVSADVEGSLFSLFSGIGFEALESKYLSLPLFLGFNTAYYSTTVSYPEYQTQGFSYNAETTGSGFVGGLSGGIAAKLKYRGLSLTPYYLFLSSFNGADFFTEIKGESSVFSESFDTDHSLEPYKNGYFGLTFSLKTRSGWFYNLSMKNLFPSFSTDNDAFDFTAVILSAGYVR